MNKKVSKYITDEILIHVMDEGWYLGDEIIAAITELLELRERTRWIPVSENLPEDDIEVLVFDGLDIFLAICSDGVWYTDGHAVDVEAWQLLPEIPEVTK